MLDEDFLKKKSIVWYKRILIGSIVFALLFLGVIVIGVFF